MDAFEEIVAGLFRQDGYWTRQSYKVNLTKDEKRAIGKPSTSRPEIDILAYKPGVNSLLWIECKSYLDSYGVTVLPSGKVGNISTKKEITIFSDEQYRDIVSRRLIAQVVDEGLALPDPVLQYCLVAGHPYDEKSRKQINELFQRNNWLFHDEKWIKAKLQGLSNLSYENDVAIIVAKLFERTQ